MPPHCILVAYFYSPGPSEREGPRPVPQSVVWRVMTQRTFCGSMTNALTSIRERLTGLGDECRSCVETQETSGGWTRRESVFDPATGIETETTTSSVAASVIRRTIHGAVLSTETANTVTANAYDALGRIVAMTRTVGESATVPHQSFDYAPCGDLLATHTYTNDTDYVTETHAYDALGRRFSTTDALGNTVYRSYDPHGNVVAEWGATYPLRQSYDTAGRRTSLSTTRDDGATWDTTTWTYDPATGLCTSKTYADDSTITYTYTPDGHPLRTTYASGAWVENMYNERRQVVGVMYSDDEVVAFDHDEFGNEIAASNEVASVVSLRSSQGDCTNETATVCNENKTTARAFDGHRRLTEFAGTSYAYNPDGLLASISNNIALVEYAYTPDLFDAGYSLTLSNGVVFSRNLVRDDFRRSLVTGIANSGGGATAESLAYVYDALNRPTSRNDDTFGYNGRSEVTAATITGGSPSPAIAFYGYDEIGNLLQSTLNAATNTYSVNNLNQYTLVECVIPNAPPCTVMPTYDIDGNMLSDGKFTFIYDAANRLKTVSTNGVIVFTNFYDAKSRRVRKVTPEATTTFFYDNWNLIEERVAYTNGTTSTIHYFWGKDLSGTLQGAGGVGGLLYLMVDGAIYIPSYDNNGNITRYLDANGNTVAQYIYDAFGNIISKFGPSADFFRHRFSTKYFDAEIGLFYYGYRFYHPVLTRWLTRDPMEEEGGGNLYGFCMNNSLRMIDAIGQFAIYVHTEGMVGHVGLRAAGGIAYDYGRYHGTYSGLGAAFSGPNILKTNQWEMISSTHTYKIFDFNVCKELDDGVIAAANASFDNGMAKWPHDKKFSAFLDLKPNERYMGTDWSWNADNCMTFTFRTIAVGVKEAQRKGRLSPKAQRQARVLLLMAFDSCWQTRPAAVEGLLENYARSFDWISESKQGE